MQSKRTHARKTVIATVAGFAIAAGIFTPLTANAATQCITGESTVEQCVPDLALAQIVAKRTALYDVKAIVTQAALDSLTYISGSAQDITSLDGLEHFRNLETVDISDTKVTDISALKDMSKLTTLDFSNDKITDFSPLATLPALNSLGANNTGFSDLTPLANLTNLQMVRLESNGITSLAPLSNLKNIQNLAVSENTISDLSPLTSLTQLTGFTASKNNISDVSPLSNLTKLNYVLVSYNHITDISPLTSNPTSNLLAQGQTATLPAATITEGEPYTLQAPNGVQKGTLASITTQTPEGATYDEATGKLTFANLPVGDNAISYSAAQDDITTSESGAKITRRYGLTANQTVTVTKKAVTSNAGSAAVKPTANGTATPTKLAATGSNVSAVAVLAAITALMGAAALALQRIKH